MMAFIEEHRAVFGVEPICRVLPIAPSTYYARAGVARDPDLASDRAKNDARDCADIKRIHEASRGRYGARKIWHELRRGKHDIARCTVERPLSGHCFAMPCPLPGRALKMPEKGAMDESYGNTGPLSADCFAIACRAMDGGDQG